MRIDPQQNRRILVIDDNRAIHDDFQKILVPRSTPGDTLDEDEALLFGGSKAGFSLPKFELDSAYQGAEGVALVEKSISAGRPYALAFIDVRMPPGLDGVETTRKIWEMNPDLQVVMCTAYSDYSWEETLNILGYSDRLVILKKPFDYIEVLLLTIAMTEKWRLQQESRRTLKDVQTILEERTLTLKNVLTKNWGY